MLIWENWLLLLLFWFFFSSRSFYYIKLRVTWIKQFYRNYLLFGKVFTAQPVSSPAPALSRKHPSWSTSYNEKVNTSARMDTYVVPAGWFIFVDMTGVCLLRSWRYSAAAAPRHKYFHSTPLHHSSALDTIFHKKKSKIRPIAFVALLLCLGAAAG